MHTEYVVLKLSVLSSMNEAYVCWKTIKTYQHIWSGAFCSRAISERTLNVILHHHATVALMSNLSWSHNYTWNNKLLLFEMKRKNASDSITQFTADITGRMEHG